MSDTRSLRERFLARTEQVRVRIPIDPDAAADLEAAKAERRRLADAHEQAVKDRENKSKLSTPEPVEPDYAEVDQWISDAERRVDESSIVIVLQWRPKVFVDLSRQSLEERWTELQLSAAMAEAFYLRAEALEGDTWTDQSLSWDQIAERCTDGEVNAVGSHARMLATASDAAPFEKRGQS